MGEATSSNYFKFNFKTYPTPMTHFLIYITNSIFLEHDNRMFTGVTQKQILKVRRANREYKLVSRKVVFSTADCYIDKLFSMAQVLGKLEKALVMILPSKH